MSEPQAQRLYTFVDEELKIAAHVTRVGQVYTVRIQDLEEGAFLTATRRFDTEAAAYDFAKGMVKP